MDAALYAALAVTGVSVLAWVYLILGRGLFWRMDQSLGPSSSEAVEGLTWPPVAAVVPARNEGDMLPSTLPLLLGQDYPGPYQVFLVDDNSTDGTGEAARRIAEETGSRHPLIVLSGAPLPPGWTGKLWALEQGVRAASTTQPEYILLTDADIAHPPNNVATLVSKSQAEGLDLVSLMARLRVSTAWERLLMPAFVYFFAKLYPFRWVNDHTKSTAAAAGGCALLRREALERAGGLKSIAGELIDDCSLAKRIKAHDSPVAGRVWLGLAQDMSSRRSYQGPGGIWQMVTRTAFTQLRYSAPLLLATVLGMTLLYTVPALAVGGGLAAGALAQQTTLAWWLAAAGLLAWILMAGSYLPALQWLRQPPVLGFLLPVIAALYTMMTIDSARRYWQGSGSGWKGRSYGRPPAISPPEDPNNC